MLPRALAVLFVAAALPANVQAQIPAEEREHGYSLRSGDRVTVSLYTAAGVEVEVAGGERIIDQNGEVFLPFVQTVFVADLDQSGLRELLVELYSEFYSDPVVDVRVELRVSVTGSVGTPGLFYVHPTATVLDAIAEAGGMSPEIISAGQVGIPADQSQVRLVRDGVPLILNLRPDEVTEDVIHMLIQSGDWLHVPPRTRSRIRDEIQFWGGILGFATNVIALIIIIAR